MRTRLLAPLIGLALLGAVSLAVVGEFSAGAQAEALASQRGASVLAEIARRLEDRQRAKEIYAQLLADEPGLAALAEQGDPVPLAQLLVPLKGKLGLGSLVVAGSDSQDLLRLGGPTAVGVETAPLVTTALAGMTQSTTVAGGSGLLVLASTPIKGPRGIVGAMVVGASLSGDALKEMQDRDAVEVAVFRDGQLVGTTLSQPELVRLLGGSQLPWGHLALLNQALERFDFRAVARPLANEGLLVALVPTHDLVEASRQRSLLAIAGTATLVLVLLLAGLLLTRDIGRPLEAMAAAAQEMVQGKYHRRVEMSHVRELNQLAAAFNHLSQQIETQLAELARQAFHDPLSNLPNRALFMDHLQRALARAERRKDSVAVLFVDLDNFKVVNDSLGHHPGDQVLIGVAERLRASVRPGDTVARLGGDEFTILLEEMVTASEAVGVAERIQERLRVPYILDGHEVLITASIGIAISAPGHDRPQELLRDADVAMYWAKTNGKARCDVFEPSMRADTLQRLELGSHLQRALEREEFRVYYQPMARMETGEIVAVEALVRWQHPQRGLVLPGEFIPLAEETGLIVPLGQWVLEAACRQVRAWQAQYPGNPPRRLSVNLSARQFQHPQLVQEITRILHETDLDPHSLALEITETAVMRNETSAIARLWELRDLGIQLALDDFGTGYSSLAYLKQLPVQQIKIDRAFIQDMASDAHDLPIVRATIELAHALGLEVIAEGVEDQATWDLLAAIGCDGAQGYYLSHPLPAAAFARWMGQSSPGVSGQTVPF